jgi:hypothetical protein
VTALRILLIAFAALSCETALAADIGNTYPAGAITTRAQAEDALAAARAAETEAETAHREELERCAGKFLQNRCTQDARRKFEAQQREIRRVEVEAREVRRRIDAEERAARRAEAEAKRKAEAPPTPRDGGARQSDTDKAAAAANREQYEQRIKAHEAAEAQRAQREAAEASARAANVKAYEEKQREAAAYAKRKKEERIANEKRREERRLERERKQKELEAQGKR